jgi:hypothetical protein
MKSARTYWFAPKRFGIGYGPSTWQGWLLIVGYGVLMLVVPRLLGDAGELRIGVTIALTAAFLILAFWKTDTTRA